MQYNFQEGLLCGLLMTHDSGSYNSNKNYKPLSDPLFNYILEKYTPKVEIIMTPHYTYKYYYDVTPFYYNDDIVLWKDIQHSELRMRMDDSAHIVKGPYDYAQCIKLRNFQKAINCQTFNVFEMKVWYRDDKPIIGQLKSVRRFADNNERFHDKYSTTEDGEIIYLGTICYPGEAIKDMTITQSAPIGVLQQTYYVSSSKIYKNAITLPEGATNQPTITITYNRGTNVCHPSNYDSLIYDESGFLTPTSPRPDWSEDPIIFPSAFEKKTYTLKGISMRTAPDFSISTTGINRVFCEMSSDEFHECELELINQQYEVAKCGYLKVRDIPNFLLPKGFTNKDLPPELNRTLPTT